MALFQNTQEAEGREGQDRGREEESDAEAAGPPLVRKALPRDR